MLNELPGYFVFILPVVSPLWSLKTHEFFFLNEIVKILFSGSDGSGIFITPFLDVLVQVFVEFENAIQRCSWVQVYDEGVQAVMVEDSIVWVSRSDSTGTPGASASTTPCPALVSACLEFLPVPPVCFQCWTLRSMPSGRIFLSCLMFGELNWKLYSTLNSRTRNLQQPQPCLLVFTSDCWIDSEARLHCNVTVPPPFHKIQIIHGCSQQHVWIYIIYDDR